MEMKTVVAQGVNIAIINGTELLITDVQSALDLMATVRYETDCDRIVLPKSAISEPFFELKTRIAGDILQKFINYQIKLAIVGDFSIYSSSSLKDFIYECNKGRDLFFVADEAAAIEKLSSV